MWISGQHTTPRLEMRVLCIDRGILPIEKRVADLLGRMTLEEKARQLDLYSGTTALLNRHTDSTHAAPRALFLPDKAQTLWGNLGVGGIHDLNPTAGTGECHPEVGHRA